MSDAILCKVEFLVDPTKGFSEQRTEPERVWAIQVPRVGDDLVIDGHCHTVKVVMWATQRARFADGCPPREWGANGVTLRVTP